MLEIVGFALSAWAFVRQLFVDLLGLRSRRHQPKSAPKPPTKGTREVPDVSLPHYIYRRQHPQFTEYSHPFITRVGREGDLLKFIISCLKKGQSVGIVGAASVGKTRLAAAALCKAIHHFPDGAFWISGDLDRARRFSQAQLIRELARSRLLDCSKEPDLESAVIQRLAVLKKLLIVIDNLETAAPTTLDFLRKLPPTCVILTTSRPSYPLERLGRFVELGPMSRKEATQFLDEEIELKRTTISQELRNQFLDVAEGRPGILEKLVAAARHGRATESVQDVQRGRESDIGERMFSASYSRLSPNAQKVLLALSVFSSSASKRDLSGVTELPAVDKSLVELHDWSLAEFHGEGDAQWWVVADPVTRSYASSQPDTELIRRSFAHYFRDVATDLARRHGNLFTAYEIMERHSRNLFAAVEWCNQASDNPRELDVDAAKTLVDLFGALRSFLDMRGYRQEQIEFGEAALAAARNLGDARAIASITHRLALSYQAIFDYDKAQPLLEESVKVKKQLKDRKGVAISINQLGVIARHRGLYDQAYELLSNALATKRDLINQPRKGKSRERESQVEVAITLHQMAMLEHSRGRYSEAEGLYGETLSIWRQLGKHSRGNES